MNLSPLFNNDISASVSFLLDKFIILMSLSIFFMPVGVCFHFLGPGLGSDPDFGLDSGPSPGFGPGVPVYLAPWTACPRGASQPRLAYPPGGKLSRDILPPTLVIFTPGGQAVQASLSCPPPNTSKNIYMLFFCIILMNSDPP